MKTFLPFSKNIKQRSLALVIALCCIVCTIKAQIVSQVFPTKFEDFAAAVKGKNVVLNWRVSEEEHVINYTIEKSADGKFFTDIAKVIAAGNIGGENNYAYTDVFNSDQASVIYYRIRSFNTDGKNTFSDTRIIKTGKQEDNSISIITYPNPVSNELRVTIPTSWQSKNTTYDVVNTNGLVCKRIQTGSSSQTEALNISNLTPGFYFVIVKCNGATLQQKILKQ